MKTAIKIFKYFVILIITVSVLLFSASILLKDKVAGIILASLSKDLSTKVDIGSVRLSFFHHFPKASLMMQNVFVHSSPGIDKSEFPGKSYDTLLFSSSVAASFSISDIFSGNYTIESISVKSGRLKILTDTAGNINYHIAYNKTASAGAKTTIDLEKIDVSDLEVSYRNLSDKVTIEGKIKNGKIKSRISGDKIDFNTESSILINHFKASGLTINQTIGGNLSLSLQSSDKGIYFKKGILRIKDYDLGIQGMVDPGKKIDLLVTAHNFDISDVSDYLPEKIREKVIQYKPQGKIALNWKIKGPLTKSSSPLVDINCDLRKGEITYGKSNLILKDLSFSSSYSNLNGNSESAILTVTNFKARLGLAEYSGSFKMTDFENPLINLNLKGKLIPSELKDFFALKDISATGGSVDLNLKIESSLSHKTDFSFQDFIDLKPEIKLTFHSFTAGSIKKNLSFENVNGNLSIGQAALANNLALSFRKQRINIDGTFTNLPEWLAGRPVILGAEGNISFSRFIPESFINQTDTTAGSSSKKKAVILPSNLKLNLSFKIDTLHYKAFSSSDITGELIYAPGLITFKTLKFNALEGSVSGNGFIVQNKNSSFIARGNMTVNKVDINKSFKTFNNFGQDFIKADNLKGRLTGSTSFLIPLDSLMNPLYKSVSAEGDFHVTNGALINFEPVKHLSSFIELSELENISFDQLDNDFIIRNNVFFLPQMDIRSSAANLSINGKHGFDNIYEYHVKMLLSDLLSKKRRKRASNNTEFGVIEDDGVGRTSILLKITGRGDEVKVGYDVKAAGTTIKNSIKSERQNLKSILNQEYGWFRKDSSVNQKQEPKKQKFRISWDGNDSSGTNQPKKK